MSAKTMAEGRGSGEQRAGDDHRPAAKTVDQPAGGKRGGEIADQKSGDDTRGDAETDVEGLRQRRNDRQHDAGAEGEQEGRKIGREKRVPRHRPGRRRAAALRLRGFRLVSGAVFLSLSSALRQGQSWTCARSSQNCRQRESCLRADRTAGISVGYRPGPEGARKPVNGQRSQELPCPGRFLLRIDGRRPWPAAGNQGAHGSGRLGRQACRHRRPVEGMSASSLPRRTPRRAAGIISSRALGRACRRPCASEQDQPRGHGAVAVGRIAGCASSLRKITRQQASDRATGSWATTVLRPRCLAA